MNAREWEDWCLEVGRVSHDLRQWVDRSQLRLGVEDCVSGGCSTMQGRAKVMASLREAASSLETALSALSAIE